MDEIKRITKELIRIESTSEKLKNLIKIVDFVKKELKNFEYEDYSCNNIPSVLFYNDKSGLKSGFKIILNGHLDVVKGTKEQFNPIEKDGKIYGRGSLDMKSGCAVFIQLFKELSKEVDYPLGLLLNTDEEIGGFNGAKYIADQGLKADLLIAGEGVGLKIGQREKGVCWINLVAKGDSAHSAYLWTGNNAVIKIKEAVDKLLSIYPTPLKEEWKTTMNVASITTRNDSYNRVPDNAEAKLDFRYVPNDSNFKDENSVKKLIEKVINKDIQYKILEKEPSVSLDLSNPIVQMLKKEVTSETGDSNPLKDIHWASDIRHFSGKGITSLEFGPKGKNAHGDNEYVEVESMKKVYKIMRKFLKSID